MNFIPEDLIVLCKIIKLSGLFLFLSNPLIKRKKKLERTFYYLLYIYDVSEED